MSEELKPCPFCGGKAEAVQFTRKRWTVECFADGCGAGIISHGDMQAAISTWNTRTLPQPAAVEAVEVVGYHSPIPHDSPAEDWSYAGRVGWEPLMTVAQHNRIMAATVPAGCKVVKVELLKSLAHYLECSANLTATDYGSEGYEHARKLRAILEVKP